MQGIIEGIKKPTGITNLLRRKDAKQMQVSGRGKARAGWVASGDETGDKSAVTDRVCGCILAGPVGAADGMCEVSIVGQEAGVEDGDRDVLAEDVAAPEGTGVERVDAWGGMGGADGEGLVGGLVAGEGGGGALVESLAVEVSDVGGGAEGGEDEWMGGVEEEEVGGEGGGGV